MVNNASSLTGNCVAPFLDASFFPKEGGLIDGRFCATINFLPDDPVCCLPCPATDWAYGESFNTYARGAEWLNVVGLVLMVFLLVSYVVLPSQQTRGHYLSVCLILSVCMMALGFTIPLGARPDVCYNEITPNDMYSSTECAWSGAFLIAGGLSAATWVFVRALSMNLQICWDIVPGRKFYYVSLVAGWGIPAILFTVTMAVTGVGFRFGNACHVTQHASMADFWGPLLGIGGAAGILQVATLGYCVHVYLKNLWSEPSMSTGPSGSSLPSYTGSIRAQTARAVYQRLKKVLWLQWRGIAIVTIILFDVIFFSIVFVCLNGLESMPSSHWEKVEPWVLCVALHPKDSAACHHLTSAWIVSSQTVLAVLFMLSLSGVQVFIFLTRPSIFPAWVEFFRGKLSAPRHEFVSLDARPNSSISKQGLLKYDHVRGHQNTTFEMQKPRFDHLSIDTKSPTNTILSSPDEIYKSPLQRLGSPEDDGPGRNLSPVSKPEMSYPSHPSPPTPAASYNPMSSHQPVDYFLQQHHQQAQLYHQQMQRAYTREAPSEQGGGDGGGGGNRMRSASNAASARPESAERRYYHQASFSVPQVPSRQSSGRSVSFADESERQGVVLNPTLALDPSAEAGESQENFSPSTWRTPDSADDSTVS